MFSGEGENEESWPVDETQTEDEQDVASSNFAPRGASRFQDRVRNKLPKPLDLKNTRQGVAVEKLYTACSVRPFTTFAWFRLWKLWLTVVNIHSLHSMPASDEETTRDSWSSSATLLSPLSY